ncbi:MAG: hypothetical protein J2P49_08770 [Methylocapsa sp.]|nr:hypothetical protein [Methylocapsa sp.]
MILHLHHIPGRLRVRLAKLRHNHRAAAALRAELLTIRGVKSVSINPYTGSILLHYYQNGFEPEMFWSALRRLGYIDGRSLWAARGRTNQMRSIASETAHTAAKVLLSVLLERWLGYSTGTLVRLLS